MAIVAQTLNGTCTLAVDGEMSIYTAAELKGELLGWLEPATQTRLDLAQVSEIDAAGVQLLLLIRRQVLAAGQSLTLIECSPAVRDTLKLCNTWTMFEGQASLA
ncbi:lipid asymmetry maintenance protein MlaB [Pseudomonas sp. nanlin1]|uniref:STAS domain-containing protein n=1 Tax=Pseudomonas sp. nanlin1 TaxID=3040605 RepID=UPI00388D8D02